MDRAINYSEHRGLYRSKDVTDTQTLPQYRPHEGLSQGTLFTVTTRYAVTEKCLILISLLGLYTVILCVP